MYQIHCLIQINLATSCMTHYVNYWIEVIWQVMNFLEGDLFPIIRKSYEFSIISKWLMAMTKYYHYYHHCIPTINNFCRTRFSEIKKNIFIFRLVYDI